MRSRVRRTAVAVCVAMLLVVVFGAAASGAAPRFVRTVSVTTPKSASQATAKLDSSGAGDLFVVYAVWKSAKPLAITDSQGNTYANAGMVRRWGAGSKFSSQVFYARDIAGGSASITARTSVKTRIELYVTEYAGLNATAPLAAVASRSGNSSSAATGNVIVDGPGIVFIVGAAANGSMTARRGYAVRATTYGNVAAERQLPTGGTASASAKLSASTYWALHAVAFRVDGPPDADAPTAPTGVSASGSSATQIDVSWAAASDNVGVANYIVYRDGRQAATASGTNWSDTGLIPTTSHRYAVFAVDAAGNRSPASVLASATTKAAPDVTAPAAPQGVTASAASSTRVAVRWRSNSSDQGVAGYRVSRDGVVLAVVTTTAYDDAHVTPATSYQYSVQAFDAAGNVSTATTASVTTPADGATAPDTSAPSIPSNLAALATSPTTASVTWSASSDNTAVTRYKLYRNGTLIAAPTGTSYSDTGLTANSSYSYRVAAEDAAGNASAQSAPATITTPAAAPAPTRDPLKQPFASSSIWNMPIGSGAQYVSAGLVPITAAYTSYGEWSQIHQGDEDVIVVRPTAPLTPIYLNNTGWSGGDRCTAQGGILFTVPMPSDLIIPNSSQNNGAAFLMADGRSIVQTQPFTRCTAGGIATAMTNQYPIQDIYGSGITGAHGGSALSSIGGTLRVGELRPGDVTGPRHALKLNLESDKELYNCSVKAECFRWPAITADSNAVSSYGSATNNQNTAMKMGALLAIPTSVNISAIGLETQPARLIAWTLQNYGTYIVDTGEPSFSIETGPDGSFKDQFQSDWGMSLNVRVRDNSAWGRDVNRLLPLLSVVNNNSASSIGGGGTPLQPLAPEIHP